MTSIESYAFAFSSSLSSITIPSSITSISGDAFEGTAWFNNQPDGCVYINNNILYAYKGEMPENTHIDVNEGTTTIYEVAFNSCSSLTSITIPNSVTYIGESAFSNCSSLTSITIPNGVTSIESSTFFSCSSLSSITIPNSITSIGEYAFSYCSSLTSITIPNSVTHIEKNAFSGCSSLTSITCLSSTPPNANALEADTENCTLKVPYEAYNDYSQHAYWGQFSNIETLDTNLYKKLEILVNDTLFGYVNVSSGYYCVNNNITIHAIPNEGYEFTQWSDGNTENPRTICITSDTTITAEFRIATTPTPVENTSDNQTNIYTTHGTLHIEGATENYHILDAAGRLIYSGNATTLTLPRGIYLITINGEMKKIVL